MPVMAREQTAFDPAVRVHLHQKHLLVYTSRDNRITVLRFPESSSLPQGADLKLHGLQFERRSVNHIQG